MNFVIERIESTRVCANWLLNLKDYLSESEQDHSDPGNSTQNANRPCEQCSAVDAARSRRLLLRYDSSRPTRRSAALAAGIATWAAAAPDIRSAIEPGIGACAGCRRHSGYVRDQSCHYIRPTASTATSRNHDCHAIGDKARRSCCCRAIGHGTIAANATATRAIVRGAKVVVCWTDSVKLRAGGKGSRSYSSRVVWRRCGGTNWD
jgi:hypothetical protein